MSGFRWAWRQYRWIALGVLGAQLGMQLWRREHLVEELMSSLLAWGSAYVCAAIGYSHGRRERDEDDAQA